MSVEKTDKLARQERLLNDVFPNGGLSFSYLDWLYRGSPDGPDIPSDYVESGELLGHYTIVPQQWLIDGQSQRLALSLNTAVHENARGKGLFVKLAEESYLAAKSQGIQAVIGVANANSTPGFVRRLGFKLMCPLPVVAGLIVPIATKKAASYAITKDFLNSAKFSAIAENLSSEPKLYANQKWHLAKLRWRLNSPRGRYAIHVHETGILITTTAPIRLGIQSVVALKFLPNIGFSWIDVKVLLKQAAAFHRSPFFIYSGFNEHAVVTGISLPRRFLPSPLNLIYRRLDDSIPAADDVRIGTFEFFDFDAY